MAILKLEDSTVRVLGASQTLTDPASLIKELLDNALDAHATSVNIEISADTLDHIQVRDNGHGIVSEDRPLIARPNCTSKITTDDDIRNLRGTSLGFRGQALASAAELSGIFTVTTRVEGEDIASLLKIDQQGELVGQERASLPVGTSVRIKDFMAFNPVRKQVLLKAADKTLKKIKDLIRSYAFARPKTRLSLKVTKAKSEKYNFVYVPKVGGDIQDATLKLVGSGCASQCEWSFVDADGLTLSAFLPQASAEVTKVSGVGAFFSVDARPVTPKRGTLKQMFTLFRDALRTANPAFKSAQEVFVYLDISCPAATYDPNIEPAKDDVLFEDPDALLAAMKKLLAQTYLAEGADETRASSPRLSALQHSPRMEFDKFPSIPRLDVFANFHHTPPASSVPQNEPRNLESHEDDHVLAHDHQSTAGETQTELEELRHAQQDVQTSNPWVFAKLNTSIRPRQNEDEMDVLMIDDHRTLQERQKRLVPDVEDPALVTPRQSSPAHGPRGGLVLDVESPRSLHNAPMLSPFLDVGILPEQPQEHQSAPRLLQHRLGLDSDERVQSFDGPGLQSSPTTHVFPPGISRRAPPATPHPRRTVNNPFKPPRPSQERPAEDDGSTLFVGHYINPKHGQKPRESRSNYRATRNDGFVYRGEARDAFAPPRMLSPPRHNRDIRDFVEPVDLTDAGSLMDAHAHRPNRGSTNGVFPGPALLDADVDESEPAAMDDLPVKRRRVESPDNGILSPLDINAALLGHAHRASKGTSMDAEQTAPGGEVSGSIQKQPKKTGRRRSSKFPLEQIPNNQRMHNLAVHISCSADLICQVMSTGGVGLPYDVEAFPEAHNGLVDPLGGSEVDGMIARLREALQRMYPVGEMVQDLGELLEKALTRKHEVALVLTATQTTVSEMGTLTPESFGELSSRVPV